ncbi:MAG: phosphate ABC transporter permease subunit PstC [Anaerolineae bacterium]
MEIERESPIPEPLSFGKIRLSEKLAEGFIALNGFLAVIILLGIFLLLVIQGAPAIEYRGLWAFLFDYHWYPISDPPTFGVLGYISATTWVTLGAIVIALPLGLAVAAYLAEVAPPLVRETVKPLIELLAGVPSVVIGVIGLLVLNPIVREAFNLKTGLNGLTASIMLALMALPTIVSISEDALTAVPRTYKEASLALGVSRWDTLIHVTIPAAISGITAAVMLGIGRAIGETMTVLMVAGNKINQNFFSLQYTLFPLLPDFARDWLLQSGILSEEMVKALKRASFGLAQPMRPMTAAIAAEINNAVQGGLQYRALFAMGVILFLMTFAVNLIADIVMERQRRRFGR